MYSAYRYTLVSFYTSSVNCIFSSGGAKVRERKKKNKKRKNGAFALNESLAEPSSSSSSSRGFSFLNGWKLRLILTEPVTNPSDYRPTISFSSRFIYTRTLNVDLHLVFKTALLRLACLSLGLNYIEYIVTSLQPFKDR